MARRVRLVGRLEEDLDRPRDRDILEPDRDLGVSVWRRAQDIRG
jgi:hypothetical protein